MKQEDEALVAYHEAGHALVAALLERADDVENVTIVPRGKALGLTTIVSDEDSPLPRRDELMAKLSTLFGGRAAEEMVVGDEGITAGAANDLSVMTDIAKSMVRHLAMAKGLAPRAYPESLTGIGATEDLVALDAAVNEIATEAAELARQLLKDHPRQLKAIAEELIRQKTISRAEFETVLQGAGGKAPTKGTVEFAL